MSKARKEAIRKRKFNDYKSKVQTSNKTMRHYKRELLLTPIIASFLTGADKVIVERIVPEPGELKQSDWPKEAGLTRLYFQNISEELKRKYIKAIDSTNWLKRTDDYYEGVRQLRIYYKQLRYSGKFSLRRVMKYMYTPQLFEKILELGDIEVVGTNYKIPFALNKHDYDLFQDWADYLFNLEVSLLEEDNFYLLIDKIELDKLIESSQN